MTAPFLSGWISVVAVMLMLTVSLSVGAVAGAVDSITGEAPEQRRRVVLTAPAFDQRHRVQPTTGDRGASADLSLLTETTPLAVGLSLEAFPPTSEVDPPTEALNLW